MSMAEVVDGAIRDHPQATKWPRLVWHYCSSSSFDEIVASGQLRLMEATWQDDLTELVYGERAALRPLLARFSWSEIHSRKVPFLSSENRRPHVACFTACSDSLTHWQRYADHGRGVAVGIALRTTGAFANYPQRLFVSGEQRVLQDWGLFWFPMLYGIRDQRTLANGAARRLFDEYRGPDGDWDPESKYWVDEFSMAMAFKSPYFDGESEHRLAFGHLGPCRGREWLGPAVRADAGKRSYTPLLLKRGHQSLLQAVRLGPNCTEVTELLRKRLERAGLPGVRIMRSGARVPEGP